jgi:hypothetical protein
MAGMLQRAVATARDHSGKDCPGPDLLAAYYERSLSPAERQQWEAHFSSCGLCQAQLAALARSEPEPQLQQFWFSRWHWAWKWLPPAAVGLTAIAIWIAVHPPSVGRLEKKPLEVATTAPVSPSQQDELKEAVPGASTTSRALGSTSKAATSPTTVEKQRGKVGKLAAGNLGASETGPAKGIAGGAMPRTVAPALAKKTPLPPPVAEKATPAGQAGAPIEEKPAQDRAAAALNAEVGAATPAPSPSTSARRESSSSKIRSGNAAIAPDGAWQTAGQLRVLEVRSAEVLIASPDPAVQWRIGRGGIIERTTDGGKTWFGQFVNGLQPGLAAGSAPSAKICWVVGRAGTILRTKDGENWEKIAPPATIDFTAIKATNERAATIIAADGRSFSTQDGGKTWQVVQQDH